MPLEALTSAEISLPPKPDALRVRERIAALADSVDLVALTDKSRRRGADVAARGRCTRARTGRQDCRSHFLPRPQLELSRAQALEVEVGYGRNPVNAGLALALRRMKASRPAI